MTSTAGWSAAGESADAAGWGDDARDEHGAYDQRFRSIIGDDVHERAGAKNGSLAANAQEAEPYSLGDNSLEGDAGSPVALTFTENPAPDAYQVQMRDVLGSDDEDDDSLSPKEAGQSNGATSSALANGGPPRETNYDDQREGHVSSMDDSQSDEIGQYRPGNVPLKRADSSFLTEDGNSSISSLSVRPMRPWQYPVPRRLRMLRGSDDPAAAAAVAAAKTSMSVDDSHTGFASPSIAASSDEGGMGNTPLMPYGDPLAAGGGPVAGQQQGQAPFGAPATQQHRSFLRLTRLCGLSDKEGSPTVLAVASGVVAVGTRQGKVGLFNRSRGWTGAIAVHGCVSALAISSDKTFLAIGTTKGHIYLYDMAKLHAPARQVPPVSNTIVKAGRGEGHLQESIITHLAFIGSRRTAIVSADEHGMSFYHSLGKILGVSSNDTLRILGRYPEAFEEGVDIRETRKSTVLAMSSLPLGPMQHQSDTYNFVALLTPSKMVLVGLKPAARTWYRRVSTGKDNHQPLCGCLAWLPSSKSPQGIVHPTLAYSFGRHLHLLRLRTQQPDLSINECASYQHFEDILALMWLTTDMLAVYSSRKMHLYDLRKGRCTEEQSFLQPASNQWLTRLQGREVQPATSGSIRAHKGQLFVLAPTEILVASLVTWADRILALVSSGDPLGAVELSTRYLQDPSVGGSRIGLPESIGEQRPILASRLLELMRASTAYIFSEDRFKDDLAHYTHGVDRTPLFEGLARACAQACIALDDFSFLFEELYSAFSDAGIEGIFTDQMEDFIVAEKMRLLPTPIVKRLIDFRQKQGRYDLAERVIRNVDPMCLDLDQAINLCLAQHLYDALIYVYTQSLHDFVAPVIELLPLIRQHEGDAYRTFSYLSITLIGQTYPEQVPLPEAEARGARTSVYGFLFSGRCILWPEGSGGRLVLSLDGASEEPIYPYLRLLLDFDAEALLDALDVAFEDPWLDDDNVWSRQRIASILLDLDELTHEAEMFVAIFIARNAPKYPQFIQLAAEHVDKLMTKLSSSLLEDEDTKADREYAVECLLSAYKPAHTSTLLEGFEQAGFVDILRRVYRSEGKWKRLAELVVSQPTAAAFDDLDDILRRGKRDQGTVDTVLRALPGLVDIDVERGVALVERRLPSRLDDAVQMLDRSPHRQLSFLDKFMETARCEMLSNRTRSLYISLLCSLRPHDVVKLLDACRDKFFDLRQLATVASDEDVLDALLWVQDRLGNTEEAFRILDDALSESALTLRASEDQDPDISYNDEAMIVREKITSLIGMAVRICGEHGEESLWVSLLQKLIRLAHDTRSAPSALGLARNLLQDALSSFVTSTSSEDTSFAQLFPRLVPEQGSTYAEVRDIVDAMTGAYRLRQDVLGIANRLFDHDVFVALHRLARQRRRGWRPNAGMTKCRGCGETCVGNPEAAALNAGHEGGRSTTRHRRSPDISWTNVAPSLSPEQMRYKDTTPSKPLSSKGKGKVREEIDGFFEGEDLWTGTDDAQATTPVDDFFSSADALGNHTSTPADMFLPLPTHPALSNAEDADASLVHVPSTPSLHAAARWGGHDASLAGNSNNVYNRGIASNDDDDDDDDTGAMDCPARGDIVVCYSGDVWHRTCMPASLLQAL